MNGTLSMLENLCQYCRFLHTKFGRFLSTLPYSLLCAKVTNYHMYVFDRFHVQVFDSHLDSRMEKGSVTLSISQLWCIYLEGAPQKVGLDFN